MFTRNPRFVGISVSRPAARLQNDIADMANEAAALIGVDTRVTPEDYEITDAFIGPRYGVVTAEGMDALRLTARTEGILLDPVYTGKAMAGLIGLARTDFFAASEGVCFWHTGGGPALFAYEDDVLRACSGK
jgi:1-aminocyclopropane-1-carboxylate deaminase/D-cysteine desulfhydrase-like pyridoxal-dependent ACC family enzyme